MDEKYYLKSQKGTNFYLLVAKKDFADVKKGDIGGLVSDPDCISQYDEAWVYPGSTIEFSKIRGNIKVKKSHVKNSDIRCPICVRCIIKNSTIYDSYIGGRNESIRIIKSKIDNSRIYTKGITCDESLIYSSVVKMPYSLILFKNSDLWNIGSLEAAEGNVIQFVEFIESNISGCSSRTNSFIVSEKYTMFIDIITSIPEGYDLTIQDEYCIYKQFRPVGCHDNVDSVLVTNKETGELRFLSRIVSCFMPLARFTLNINEDISNFVNSYKDSEEYEEVLQMLKELTNIDVALESRLNYIKSRLEKMKEKEVITIKPPKDEDEDIDS